MGGVSQCFSMDSKSVFLLAIDNILLMIMNVRLGFIRFRLSYVLIEQATSEESLANLAPPDCPREEALAEAKVALSRHRHYLKGRAQCNPNWNKFQYGGQTYRY